MKRVYITFRGGCTIDRLLDQPRGTHSRYMQFIKYYPMNDSRTRVKLRNNSEFVRFAKEYAARKGLARLDGPEFRSCWWWYCLYAFRKSHIYHSEGIGLVNDNVTEDTAIQHIAWNKKLFPGPMSYEVSAKIANTKLYPEIRSIRLYPA